MSRNRRSHTRRRSRRLVQRAVLLTIVSAAMSVTIDSHQARPSPGPISADATRPVSINKTVPRVSPVPTKPVFSAQPTDAEIRGARVFAEPLVSLGATSVAENQALAGAVTVYVEAGDIRAIDPFVGFLRAHPISSWRASLLTNLGTVQRGSGFLTRALASWDEAWRLTKDDTTVHGRAVNDLAVASALDLLSTLGHLPGLEAWIARMREGMSGPAQAKAARAKEARAFIVAHPDRVIASGPKALEILLHWRSTGATATPRDTPPPVPSMLKDYRPTAAGTTLAEVRALASKVGLNLKAVRREAGAPLVLPAVVHLGFDHFSAVLEEVHGRVRLRDPALGGEVWMSRAALDEEMTGAALIPVTADAAGWREISEPEAATIVGHSCPPGLPDPDECVCPPREPGMATYSLHPVQASVLLSDVPLSYDPPRGPSVSLQLRYNHREENQPQVFSFANIGARWTLGWISYVEEVPFTWFDQFGQLQFAQPAHMKVHAPQGGVERYVYPDAQGVYPRHYRSASVLAQVSSSPLTFERRHPNGAKEIYAQPGGGVPGSRRVFLSAIVDQYGQTLSLTWDAQLRLVALTDALGQVTTLQYEGGDPLQVTSVTDPFGRIARFTYDATGHLSGITDVVSLTSSFVYGDYDFIAALITPYGTTSFRKPYLAGEYKRAVEAIDPLGAIERVEFHWKTAPVPAAVPANEVPPGFESRNAYLDEITSLHWAKGRNIANVQEAVQWRWLIYSMDWYWDPGWTVEVPHSVQRPGEARTWFTYVGVTARPARVARKLPDGSVYEVTKTYNYQDNVTSSRDPVGRQLEFTYAANGIDLLAVRNTTGGQNALLATYSNYTPSHLPQTITDAAGQATQLTFNDAGQVQTITNAKQETTTHTYGPTGYLETVTGPVAGATVTYAYDGYGRVRSATPAGEGVITTAYDPLSRPTRTTYPDGTYEETVYDKLDAATERDRAGRITRLTYNARRQLIAARDPAGRVVQQQWCACGGLDAVVDANGNVTRWERDASGRVLREVRADGVTDSHYTYDAIGRLKTATDPKQQIATYTYNLDGSVASIVYANAQITTPGVSWTYDPVYPRVTTMVDGTGTTSYTYHPPGQLGAGQVATADGPLANDVVSYSYDQLGRVATRAINGVPLTFTYDALGRVERVVNLLGAFDYTYDGVSTRLATVRYPNNQTSTYSYFPESQDHRLQTLDHKYPNGVTFSKFDYTYDAVGKIATWRQQGDTTAVLWEYGYDRTDQLIRAFARAVDPPGTILQRFAYGYDPSGNRLFEQIDDQVTTWTYDRLNRLATQRAGGVLRVTGTVNEPATVRVQGQPAAVDAGGAFVSAIEAAAGTTRFTITATDASGNVTTQSYDVDQMGPAKTFTFDANGNMTSDSTRTFEWDAKDQLTTVRLGQSALAGFQYDGHGRRVARTAGAVSNQYVFDGPEVAQRRVNGTPDVHYFDGPGLDEPQASRTENGVASYYAADHLGSVTATTDASGGLRTSRRFDPWGRLIAGELDAGGAFNAKELDSDIGLYFYRARYYSPDTGRFISEDPIRFRGGTNYYLYTENDPIGRIDPFGLDWMEYTGQRLTLYGGEVGDRTSTLKSCPATSGMPDFQRPEFQSTGDRGPVPEGLYRVNLGLDPGRFVGVTPNGEAFAGYGVQRIPGPSPDWGTWRARLEKVRLRNPTSRDNFYLHNSHKGFTHGCIETCDDLLDNLVDYHRRGTRYLPVNVRYTSGTTNGGTRR